MVYTISTTVPYSGRTELIEITGPEGVVFVCDHSQSEPRVVWINAVWDGTFTETITFRMKTADGGYSSETTTTTSQQINGCSACPVQGIWSTDSNDNLVSDRPIFYTTENPWQDFWNRVTALAREYFDTPHTKLVVKGQSENVEFQAIKTADFPRIAFPEGSYYPLIEDDGSEGTTLKVKLNGKIYKVKDSAKKLTIFKDGKFFNVIDGFDISQFQTVVDGTDTYEKIVPYLGSKWGINNKASNNSGDFIIDGNYIIKVQQSTFSVAGTYFIPIKKVSGFDKIRLTAKMKDVKNSNYIGFSAYTSNPSTPTTPFITVGGYEIGPNYNDTDEVQVATILDATKDIDYVRVMGDIGTPAYNNIQLIKDSVRKSETPIDVIFDNGQFKSGVTTDFEFSPGKTATIQAGGTFESAGLPIYLYSKYCLSLLMRDSNPYLIRDEYLKKPIYEGAASDAALGNLYIPIKRAYGYTKCKVTMGLLTDTSQSATYVACVPGYVNSSRALVNIVDKTVYHNTNMIEYTLDISNAPYVDYIILGGAHGEPAWTKIVLE